MKQAVTPLLVAVLAIGGPAAALAAAGNPYTYVHHPVSTDNAAAQFAFDRGLTMVFAYQPEEAGQAFREAAHLDPTLAMAWWGIALNLGPNINVGPTTANSASAAAAPASRRSRLSAR